MRIFYNPRDRKGLEYNEKQAVEAAIKQVEHERMESESSSGASSEEKQEEAKETKTTDASSKKTWKKKTKEDV